MFNFVFICDYVQQDFVSSEVQVSSSPGRVVETDHLAPHADLLTLLKLLRSFSSESKKYWDLCVMEIYSDLIIGVCLN